MAKGQETAKAQEEIAVIETGGKQYTVSAGDVIEIEKLPGAKEGSSVTFDKVLMVDDGKDTTLGDPYIKGAKVKGTVESVGRKKKIDVIHFRAKSRYFKQQGHRQPAMKVKITSLS